MEASARGARVSKKPARILVAVFFAGVAAGRARHGYRLLFVAPNPRNLNGFRRAPFDPELWRVARRAAAPKTPARRAMSSDLCHGPLQELVRAGATRRQVRARALPGPPDFHGLDPGRTPRTTRAGRTNRTRSALST